MGIAIKGPLYHKLVKALCRHGFHPTPLCIDGLAYPELRDFIKVYTRANKDEGKSLLYEYLSTMFNDLADNISPLADVICMSNGTVMALPLFIIAFSFHLMKCSATGIGGKELLKSKLAGGTGSLSVFNPKSMAMIDNPRFSDFDLVNFGRVERNFTTLCRFSFKDASHCHILGVRDNEGLSRDHLLPFSFNFSEIDDESRVFECVIELVKENPEKFFSHPEFARQVHKWKKLSQIYGNAYQLCSEYDISHAHSATALAATSFAQV